MDRARREQFKKTGGVESGRKGRHETTIQIRKVKKDQQISSRRKMEPGAEESPVAPGGNTGGMDMAFRSSISGQTPGLSDKMRERLAKLPLMVQGIYSNDKKIVHESTEQIRKLLSIERKPPIEEVIATGIVPRLVQFIMQDESTELQFEAAWALTNIASGTTNHTRVVVEAGAVPIFTKLLLSPNADVREQAIWALGNIAGDTVAYRNMVLETGAMPLLLEQLSRPTETKISVIRNGTWTLSNFCRGKPPPKLSIVHPALAILSQLIKMTDEDVIVDACWALSYISDGTSEKIDAIIASGVCPRLVELLTYKNETVQTPALRAVGNIVTGSDQQTQVVINLGVLHHLVVLLGARKTSIVKEACWTISNITAGVPGQIQAVLDAHLFPPLIHLLTSSDFDVKKEAAWAVSNATSGGAPEQIKYLVNQGAIPPFCALLEERDANLIVVALDCLENILKVGQQEVAGTNIENPFAILIEEAGGIEKIEDLSASTQSEVCEKATKIIDDYFGSEDDHPAQFAPGPGAAAGGNFNYNFN